MRGMQAKRRALVPNHGKIMTFSAKFPKDVRFML